MTNKPPKLGIIGAELRKGGYAERVLIFYICKSALRQHQIQRAFAELLTHLRQNHAVFDADELPSFCCIMTAKDDKNKKAKICRHYSR